MFPTKPAMPAVPDKKALLRDTLMAKMKQRGTPRRPAVPMNQKASC